MIIELKPKKKQKYCRACSAKIESKYRFCWDCNEIRRMCLEEWTDLPGESAPDSEFDTPRDPPTEYISEPEASDRTAGPQARGFGMARRAPDPAPAPHDSKTCPSWCCF